MKTKFLNRFLLTVVCAWAMTADAALYQINFNGGIPNGPAGPHGNATGSDVRAVSGLTDTDVRVQLNFSSNGDLYVCLAHASGFFALLNRSGCMGRGPFRDENAGGDLTQSQLNISSVPEPVHVALGIFGGLCATVSGARFGRRHKRSLRRRYHP
jgi:hypothetical protein